MPCRQVGQVELRAGQPLVEKPDAARVAAGRRGADEGLDWSGPDGEEQPLEDGQVEAFVLEGEGQMAFERCGGACRGVSMPPSVLAPESCGRSAMADRVRGKGTGRP